jgi:hypothetical protein
MASQQSVLAHVRRQFLSGALEVATEAENILEADCTGVYVRDLGLPPNRALQARDQQPSHFNKMRMQCAKLKAHGYGDFSLSIGWISARYFESREQFDRLYAHLWLRDFDGEEDEKESQLVPVKTVDRISLVPVLAEHFDITLSCSMDYYMCYP